MYIYSVQDLFFFTHNQQSIFILVHSLQLIIMKTLVFTLLILSIINSFAGGSPDPHLYINRFERTFNFYYKSIDDTIRYSTTKGKSTYELATVNIAFFDISNETTSYLFPKDFNEQIEDFFYEIEYNDSTQSIVLSEDYLYYGKNSVSNNYYLPKRKPSEKIFITTYSYETHQTTIWTCHKTGKNLAKIATYNNEQGFYMIDILNTNITTVNEGYREVKIEAFPY